MANQPNPTRRERPAAIDEAALDQISGALPAVQKVREAATRMKTVEAAPRLTSD